MKISPLNCSRAAAVLYCREKPANAMIAVAIASATLLSACFAPTYDHPSCGPNGACPDGFLCNMQVPGPGTCEPPGGPPIDAAMMDAAMMDAAMGDGTMSAGCPSPYASIAGSSHRYKDLINVSWDQAKSMCALTSTAAYLAVPDDATELANLATIASAPFWVGIDDQAVPGMFVTSKGVPFPLTSPLWAPGEPNTTGGQDCVEATSATQLATDKCGTIHAAVCECEP